MLGSCGLILLGIHAAASGDMFEGIYTGGGAFVGLIGSWLMLAKFTARLDDLEKRGIARPPNSLISTLLAAGLVAVVLVFIAWQVFRLFDEPREVELPPSARKHASQPIPGLK